MSWDQAHCRKPGVDPDIFFPADHDAAPTAAAVHGLTTSLFAQARRVCSGCPMKGPCLQLAQELKVPGEPPLPGIWGGMTERERQRLSMPVEEIERQRAVASASAARRRAQPGYTERENELRRSREKTITQLHMKNARDKRAAYMRAKRDREREDGAA